MRYLIIFALLFCTGCASWAEVQRDENGNITRVKYSNNQEVEITKDGFKGNNKMESPLKDIVNVQAIKN